MGDDGQYGHDDDYNDDGCNSDGVYKKDYEILRHAAHEDTDKLIIISVGQ